MSTINPCRKSCGRIFFGSKITNLHKNTIFDSRSQQLPGIAKFRWKIPTAIGSIFFPKPHWCRRGLTQKVSDPKIPPMWFHDLGGSVWCATKGQNVGVSTHRTDLQRIGRADETQKMENWHVKLSHEWEVKTTKPSVIFISSIIISWVTIYPAFQSEKPWILKRRRRFRFLNLFVFQMQILGFQRVQPRTGKIFPPKQAKQAGGFAIHLICTQIHLEKSWYEFNWPWFDSAMIGPTNQEPKWTL